MQKALTTRAMVTSAMLAALYTALCLALAPLGYGPVQFRVAEALTLMPVFSPLAIWGLTIGCLLSNLIGFMIGANALFMDIFIGTAATLVAAILSYLLRKIKIGGLPVLSAIPPVLVNALVLGLEFTYLEVGGFNAKIFAINALNVGVGQAVSCFALGLPLVYLLQKTGAAQKCFGDGLAHHQ